MAAAPAAPQRGEAAAATLDEGMDILKFFIAIMGFLTLLVAGLAVYNWTQATDLEAQVAQEEERYESLKLAAASPPLREMIAQDRANKEVVDVLKKDLGQFLDETAGRMGIKFATSQKRGAEGFRQQGFDKFSYELVLDKVTLETVTEFLFYIQLAWPGLKIEEVIVKEALRPRRDDPFPGWNVTMKISIFRPSERRRT